MRLLGYFLAGQTKQASELLQGEEAEDAIWVVLKWEGLAPLALYPSAQQTSGIGLGRLFGAADSSMSDRARMLRWGQCVCGWCGGVVGWREVGLGW